MSVAAIRRVIVPSVPDRVLSPNAPWGVHWAVKDRAKKALQREWVAEVQAVRPDEPIAGPVSVHVRVLWPARRSIMDKDNCTAMMKYVLDSFTIGGMWVDDSQITVLDVAQEKLDKTGRTVYPNGCTVVDVAEVNNG